MFIRCILSITAGALLIFSGFFGDHSHSHAKALDDEKSFQEIRDAAFGEINSHLQAGEHEAADSLRLIYAEKFADFYHEQPDNQEGHEALHRAFMMWGNAGADEAIDEILPEIPKKSEVWVGLFPGIENAYGNADRGDDYEPLLYRLSDELSHPRALSELLRTIGVNNMQAGDVREARSNFQEVLELDADEWITEFSEMAVYELDSLAIGESAPDFSVESIDGTPLTLSDYQGELVLLTVWSPTCGPSMNEMEYWNTAQERFGDEDFQVISIARGHSPEQITGIVEEHGADWPQILATGPEDKPAADYPSVMGTPGIYVVGPDGAIVANQSQHSLRGDDLIETVQDLLE